MVLVVSSVLFYRQYIKLTKSPQNIEIENNENTLQDNKNNLIKNLKYNVKFDDNTEYSIAAD